MFNNWPEKLLSGLLLLSVLYFSAVPINLATADLGRHIKNGELLVQGKYEVLTENLYSYTHPEFHFTNHHWGSGVVFYLVHQTTGFNGLSLLVAVLSVITFWLFFEIARKWSNFYLAFLTAILLFPVIIYRTEIRPEAFSYLFLGIVLWLLNRFIENKNVSKSIFWLVPLMLLWVNLHIYFFLGFALLAIYGIELFVSMIAFKDKKSFGKLKILILTGVFCLAAVFLNPHGINGVIAPLNINQNYGYRVLENQSLVFLERVIGNPVIIYFKLAFGVLVLSWVILIITGIRNAKNEGRLNLRGVLRPEFTTRLILSVMFGYLGWIMLRNVTIAALFFLPVIAGNLNWLSGLKNRLGMDGNNGRYYLIPGIIVLMIFISVLSPDYWEYRISGLGLFRGVEGGADFFKQNGLKGPIFNNYDVGGYLIYELYPAEKVFVDNRPETYPEQFFKEVYIPSQEDENKWRETDNLYRFNSIFFYRHDLTPWAQKFLISKVKDPDWAPVFVDDFMIIFLKRNEQNAGLISKYELPKAIFGIKE